MIQGRWVVGVDVGGTRTSVGLVSEGGRGDRITHESTPRASGAHAVLENLVALTEDILSDSRHIIGIGIGFGGPVDHERRRVRLSHHVEGWAGMAIADVFAERFQLPAWLENDANAAGLAEAVFGAGRGHDSVLYVNIGTGVGGALILNGQIHHGANSNAGEFGHIVLEPDGPQCTCGKRGCVEALCSGDALARMATEADLSDSTLAELPPDELSGRTVGEYARRGDEGAVRLVRRSAHYLGLAIAGAVNLCDPAVVVLGGGVPQMGDVYLQPVRRTVREYAMDVPAERLSILPAQLGYNAGVIGAGTVALSHHKLTAAKRDS